jgi:hypothetical protein
MVNAALSFAGTPDDVFTASDNPLDIHRSCIYIEHVDAYAICITLWGGKSILDSLGRGMMRVDYHVVAISEKETWNRNGPVLRPILETRLPRRMNKSRSKKSMPGNPWNVGTLLMAPL